MKNSIKLLAITALIAVIGFAFTACDDILGGNTDGKDDNKEADDVVISIAAIAGVTAPVPGAVPVTSITANDQYTGTVSWNGTPAKFAYSTEYTATITLTAKSGYTLQGVAAGFFSVAGATQVSNAANSGVVTATFAKTEDDPFLYIINADASSFKATQVTRAIGITGTIQDVIDAIRTDANGDPVSIQFGDGSDPLNIDTASAQFNTTGGTWGLITLSGKITSANVTTTEGTVLIGEGVSVNSTADIANTTSNTSARAVYIAGTGTVNISGGTVSATSGRAVYIAAAGTVDISGGEVSATSGYAVYNGSNNGKVNISGGTVSVTTGRAVFNYNSGPVNISGGTVSATTGYAVYNDYNGTITVSGNATVTSANTSATYGTIYNSSTGTTVNTRIAITGGTVQNTSAGNAIYNVSAGTVSVSGGTISAPLGFAVANTNASAALTLSGTPLITGNLRAPAGKLSVTDFIPGSNKYSLDFASYTAGAIAVTDGGAFVNNFTLFYQLAWKLEADDGNLVIAADTDPNPGAYSYTITTSGSDFTAQKGSATIANGTGAIQDVINAIRTDAFGRDISIQLGSGSDPLDIGTGSAQFSNAGGYWGLITLSGKITSANVTTTEGTVLIGANISVNSTADIANTASSSNARAMYIAGATGTNTQTVNIQSGTVAATATYSRAVHVAGASTVNISNATVSATTGHAVFNASSDGKVNISGGTVSATTGVAVRNDYNGAVTISGGTVSATTGQAVFNDYNGTITVSGTALVTSANTSTTYGTIYCSTLGSSTTTNLTRIIITGGTVQNTSTSTNGNAVYNASVGRVEISGGTVSAPAYAVQCTTTNTTANTGAIILGGDPTITGRLRPSARGRLSVTTSFNPSTGRSYVLDYAAYTAGDIAVGGASSATNFSLYNQTAWELEVSVSNLVIKAKE